MRTADANNENSNASQSASSEASTHKADSGAENNLDHELVAKLSRKVDLARLAQAAEELDAGELEALVRQAVRRSRPHQPPPINGDYYDVTADLTPQEAAYQKQIRHFLEQEARPIINEYWERGEFPKELIRPIGQLLCDTLDADGYQFPHPSPLMSGILSLELGRTEPSVSTFIGVHRSLCMGTIFLYGSDEQKARWLPAMRRFEKIGSWALTEPLVGSAAAAGLQTTARRDGAEWVLNGEKKWSGNATFADVNVIWARNEESGQVNGFLVERPTPGYHVEKLKGKIAKRAVENVLIQLDNCRIPLDNRLPGVNSFRDVGKQLAVGRAGVAWEATGIAMGAYERSLAYCNQRAQFGRPITSFQLVQAKLVQMLGNVTAMLSMMRQLTRLQERDGFVSHERASLAKAFCSEKMRETVALARGVMGGNGILLEYDVARLFADAEAVYSYEGTYEMNTLIVGRAITGISAFV
ncbi:MAG: acyl-CoA dehydrogenase family protein [Caldilineaceae bacterium]|nr:acyl-CoA dehydrogenase family protein [Caldilineaceae bacterium]